MTATGCVARARSLGNLERVSDTLYLALHPNCFRAKPHLNMAHLFLALFLIVFGLNILIGLAIPLWIVGLLAVIAGLMLVLGHFRVRVDRK